MRKIWAVVLSFIMVLSIITPAFAAEVEEHVYEECVEEGSSNTKSINLEEEITLIGGDTWKKSFSTSRWWLLEDHNAFKVTVNNVTGSYKVMILMASGNLYTSNGYTNQGATLTVTNVDSEGTYVVSVINTSSTEDLTATVAIQSYIE